VSGQSRMASANLAASGTVANTLQSGSSPGFQASGSYPVSGSGTLSPTLPFYKATRLADTSTNDATMKSPVDGGDTVIYPSNGQSPGISITDTDLQTVVAHLEELQFAQRSPQQPNPKVDRAIESVLATRPEWRARMAIMTSSVLLRQKILSILPPGGRAAGSAQLGSTHDWRTQFANNRSDHDWPKVDPREGSLPGGEYAPIRHPIERCRRDPTISSVASWTVPKAKRFAPGGESEKGATLHVQKNNTPGPGAYFKSLPRGVPFTTNGETVIYGPNHVFPSKSCLGHHMNPIHVDFTVLTSAPKWTMPRMRRNVSDVVVGNASQFTKASGGDGAISGGPIKSDAGCLSPGFIYEHYSAIRPVTDLAVRERGPRRSRSMPSIAGVRKVRVKNVPGKELDEGGNSSAA